MSHLFLHITTIPCQRPGFMADLRANVTAPAKLSNADSIKKWLEENGDAAAQEAFLKTAYDGTLGEIIAIAWAFDGEEVRCVNRSLYTSESVLLEQFFTGLQEDVLTSGPALDRHTAQIVGHNILGFDLRFLFQRAVILSVQPPFDLGHDNRYNNSRIYDVMMAWAGFNKFLSLPDLARAIGFDSSPALSAVEVWHFVKGNNVDAIADLCIQNVSLVRQVFHAMTFSEFYAEVIDVAA
jgi:3'-5' exonuclease